MKHSSCLVALTMVGVLMVAGCATPTTSADNTPSANAPAPTQGRMPDEPAASAVAPPSTSPSMQAEVPAELSASEKSLASAIATFDRGEYALAIRQLTPLTTDAALDKASQLRALKSLAFSQCLSRATTACRQSFERAFRLDPKFDLAPAERGHPVWAPEFERARKAVAAVKAK